MAKLVQNLFWSIVLVSVTLFVTSDALVRRLYYEAFLYEKGHEDSEFAQYSRTKKEDWKDLSKVAASANLSSHALVCTFGDGAWIAYPNENYMILDKTYVHMIIGEECIETETVKSLQPLGAIREPLNGVVIFPNTYYQGEEKIVRPNNGSFSGNALSLAFTGDFPWTINGKYCMFPPNDIYGGGLCMIPDVEAATGLKPPHTIKSGCEGQIATVFTPQNCYQPGVYSFYANIDYSQRNMAKLCGGSGSTPDQKGKFAALMEIWKGRIHLGIEDSITFQNHDIKTPFESNELVSLLQRITGVFHVACPAVDPKYLSILKNAFLWHLRSTWASNPIVPSDQYFKHAGLFIDSCYSHIGPLPGAMCVPKPLAVEDSPEALVFLDMLLEHDYDLVIEQMWLIFNTVTPTCNALNSYRTNDWIMIGTLLKKVFFEPVSKQWANPQTWQRLYYIMFHGFDVKSQKLHILGCVQNALRASPHYDPIGRTEYFEAMARSKYANLTKDSGKNKPGGGGGDGGGDGGGGGGDGDHTIGPIDDTTLAPGDDYTLGPIDDATEAPGDDFTIGPVEGGDENAGDAGAEGEEAAEGADKTERRKRMMNQKLEREERNKREMWKEIEGGMKAPMIIVPATQPLPEPQQPEPLK